MNHRIIVVEDETSACEWLQTILEREGYDIRTAEDGTTAEDIFMKWRPTLMVINVGLPDGNGFELWEKLRKYSHPEPLVIFESAAATPRMHEEAERHGGILFEKPIEPDLLLDLVRNLLSAKSGRSSG